MKRGYFGIGVYHPKTKENIGTLWREALLYGADFIFTIGKRYKAQPTDTPKATKHVPLFEFGTMREFKNYLPKEARVVCIELTDEARSLKDLVHPERAVYLLGAEDYGIPQKLLSEYDLVVKVPQVNDVISSNVAVTGSIVMYDRLIKTI